MSETQERSKWMLVFKKVASEGQSYALVVVVRIPSHADNCVEVRSKYVMKENGQY